MPSPTLFLLLVLPALVLAVIAAFLVFLIVRYTPIIGRIFEEKPLFLPLRVPPRRDGEDVRFTAADGLELAGTYLPARVERRSGVLVFCHEFLSDRWSYQPYADALRDLGFDIFAFDFRNHGASGGDPAYQPLQWVSDHEVRDLQAALDYLRSRPDRDPAGFGLFGISKGGGTALVVAAGQPDVWGVITDGAFPTRGTMHTYILHWAEIFVTTWIYCLLRDCSPQSVFSLLGWVARRRAERRLSCRFPSIERAAARLSPRPWLMIHGQKDAYIKPEIARRLFDEARAPKELWIVPGAKHNRCREVDAEAYAARVVDFLRRNAPRPFVAPAVTGGDPASPAHERAPDPAKLPVNALAPVARGERIAPAQPLSGGLAASVSG